MRLVHITKDQQILSDILAEMQKIQLNTTDSDFTQAKVVHSQLIRKQTDMHALTREIERIRSEWRIIYMHGILIRPKKDTLFIIPLGFEMSWESRSEPIYYVFICFWF